MPYYTMDNQIQNSGALQSQSNSENNKIFKSESNASSGDNPLVSKNISLQTILLIAVAILVLVSVGINIFLFVTKTDNDSSNAQSQITTNDAKPTISDNKEVDDVSNDLSKDLKVREDEENLNEIAENDEDEKPVVTVITQSDEPVLSGSYSDEYISFSYPKDKGWMLDVEDTTSTPFYAFYLDEKDNPYGTTFNPENGGSTLILSYKVTENSCVVSLESAFGTNENSKFEVIEAKDNESGKEITKVSGGISDGTFIRYGFCFANVAEMSDPYYMQGKISPANLVGSFSQAKDISEEDAMEFYASVIDSIRFKN